MKIVKIGIFSLGLIGGSILKALSSKGYELYAVTGNKETLKKAKSYTDNVSEDINILKSCDIVFVCSPMSKTLEVLDKLEQVVAENTIVCDVCSLKDFVMQKQRPYIFVGSHPMAGTENSGFDASFAELFEGAKWVLTPAESVQKSNVQKLMTVIEATGASVLLADAKEHDKAVALISHMPMLVAQALVKTAMPDSLAVKLASSGFRDTTRLALSNTDMAADMIKLNGSNITAAVEELAENIHKLLKEDYSSSIKSIKDYRASMYSEAGKNILN